MKKRVGVLVVGLLIFLVPFTQEAFVVVPKEEAQASGGPTSVQAPPEALGAPRVLGGMEPFFEENMGQWDDEGVLYVARGDGVSVAFTRAGVRYDLGGAARFALAFGDGRAVTPLGQEIMRHRVNYLIGNDPAGWIRGAASFGSIIYKGVYDGADLRFRFQDDTLKYDVLLGAGVDVGTIVLSYEGIDGLSVDAASGDLLIRTSAGTVRDLRPVFYQEGLADGEGVPGDYLLLGDGRFGFLAPDACSPDVPLVIDPGIQFCTLLGGFGWDEGLQVAVDSSGDIILAGQTNSSDMPTTPGANNTNLIGFIDGFCAKYDPTGSDLLFMTYFGGTLDDYVFDMELLPDGTMWFVGMTYSRDLPTTDDALFPDFLGGYVDGFLIGLSSDGSDLIHCTYVGGAYSENLRSLEYDSAGNLYMGGVTNSWDLPVTPGAYCMTRTDFSWDLNSGYVIKVNSSLTKIDYCTYINDLGIDSASYYPWFEIALASDGRVYVASATNKASFPVTGGAFCTTKRPGYIDGFVLCLNPTGTDVLYSTFLGGDGEDSFYFVDVDEDGLVYATGYTNSTDYPTSPDAFCSTVSLYQDAIFTVLDSTLSSLEYSTYFGGNGGEVAISSAASTATDQFYIYISTRSSDLTTTMGCFDPVKRGYYYDPDCFIVAFDSTDHSLAYSSYLGGSLLDGPSNKGIICDDSGDLLLVGGTTSTDFPTTPGANQTVKDVSMDAFLLKLTPTASDVAAVPSDLRVRAGDGRVNLSWAPYVDNEYRILRHIVYRRADGPFETLGEVPWPSSSVYVDDDVVNGINYTYAISAVNSAGESEMSAAVSGIPLARPGVPLNVTATTGDGTVRLNWSAPNKTGGFLLGYHILRGISPDSLSHLATVGVVNELIDTDLLLGETYYYAIIAFNGAGNSTKSQVVSVKALGVPTKPLNFGATPGDTKADLYWERPSSDGGAQIEGYRLHRGTTPWEMTLLADLDRTVTTYSDSSLENGRSYYYYVTAYTSVGEGVPSQPLQVIPFTLPTEPRALLVEAGDDQVTLSWSPPLSDGGRPLTGYRVHFSEGDDSLSLSFDVGNVTTHVHTGLTNGVVYYYAVSAITVAGIGPMGNMENATPMGLPGAPTDFLASSELGTVALSWSLPADMGGAQSLVVRVYRGTSQDAVDEIIVELIDGVEHLDTAVDVGTTYWYRIEAVNVIGGTSTETMSVKVTILPGPIQELALRVGDGYGELTWDAPADDGASPITGYAIMRGPTDSDLTQLALVGTVFLYNDTSVVNGQTYYFSVRAVTAVGTGPAVEPIIAQPLGKPPAPGSLTVDVKDGKAVLTWTAPTGEGRAPATGYRVYRGTAPGDLVLIATLGDVLTYTDKDVKAGKTYYYSVVADSAFGSGQMSSEQKAKLEAEEGGLPIIPLLILLVVVILIAIAVVAYSRRGKGVAAAAAVLEEGKAPYLVEEAFVVLQDGRLITHGTRAKDEEADVSMMSGMLIAVQGIMQDGLDREGALESIKYGDNLIQVATGQHVNVVAVVYGTPDEDLMEHMQTVVQDIEASYAGVLENWIGDFSVLEGINEMVDPLLERTMDLTREDVARAAVRAGVSLQSAVDFHQGYVRLKVAAVNASEEAIMDAGVEVHYDRDLLRLDKVEPEGVRLRGDKAEVGNVKAGERKALAFLFDPQICQDTYVDGTLTFYDAKGELKHVEMKRRHANVVCPIFFTREHANTAMLRRLVQEKLHVSDARIFSYPESLRGEDVLEVGKKALSGIDVQLVREFITKGPPFEAEVWYYGETQVKGYKIVMRIGVLADRNVLEFFAASTEMEPITGLLAEFRRELEGAMQEAFPGTPPLKPEWDSDVRYEVEARPLRIEEVMDEEEEG